MTGTVRIFDHLALEFPEKEIFFRLGGHCVKTELAESERLQFMRISRQAFELCTPCGRWKLLKISEVLTDEAATDAGNLVLGREFLKARRNAEFLWCGAVTIGKKLTDKRDELASTAEKAVYDAVGSECADAAMDILFRLSRNELYRRNLILDERRFSPGYGDMPLNLQRFFYQTLDMKQMGITLTEVDFMLPEKSVTAFAFVNTLQEK